MHALMIGAAVFLMAVWLLLLPLRLVFDWRRGLHEQVSSISTERGALEAPTDGVERS
jgi:hypothetical protein